MKWGLGVLAPPDLSLGHEVRADTGKSDGCLACIEGSLAMVLPIPYPPGPGRREGVALWIASTDSWRPSLQIRYRLTEPRGRTLPPVVAKLKLLQVLQ